MTIPSVVPDAQIDNKEAAVAAAPVSQAERIKSLDTLRGFALLGILLMNIVGFGLYSEAYDNPTAAGGSTGANLWAWAILHVLAEGKMRCLFSLVFGASAILLLRKLEGRPDAADIYYRRTLWLFLFGVAHGFLLWQGEILYAYAICALPLYAFRNMRPRGLILVAVAGLVFLSGFATVSGYLKRQDRIAGEAAIAKAARSEKLTEEETTAMQDWQKAVKERNPSAAVLQKDAEAWRGNVISVIKERGKLYNKWNSIPYYHPFMFDIWGMMFLGMALFKMGILDGTRSPSFYARLALIGYGIGVPLGIYTASVNIRANFDPIIQNYAWTLYQAQRLAVTFGHAGLLMLLCRTGSFRFLTDRLAAVGQMAFTNYLTHSVICAFLFTGYGLGLYGRLERYQLYYVVAAIWLFQLIVSPIWLRHFRFGPLEWCWRALTYWRPPPFRLRAPVPITTGPLSVPA